MKSATSGHTCKIQKLFISTYSGGRVGRFSREVRQTPTHTLALKQRFPENLILQLYVTFYETRKPYSVTDKYNEEDRMVKANVSLSTT
jgi:hypothetical protein